jgi:SprT protein
MDERLMTKMCLKYIQVCVDHEQMDSLPLSVQTSVNNYLCGIDFKTVKPRKTALGIWRFHNNKHEITINNDLTGVQFMITLVHEIAHARTWDLFRGSVKPHGQEWKDQYRKLMLPLLQGYFDINTETYLKNYMKNPNASSQIDVNLRKITTQNSKFVEDVPIGTKFKLSNGKEYTKIKKIRVRWHCVDSCSRSCTSVFLKFIIPKKVCEQ